MEISPQRIQVTCSRCGNLYPASVWQIVDVQLDPDLKRQLLRGQINVNTCPNCGHRVAVGTPLAYHDSDKELFLILVPTELSLSREEQEKAIGELTNMLMVSLPAEKRKGYLFQPRTFFSMRSLQEEILRADGVTAEMIEDQMEKSQLIQELLAQVGDEASLKTLVEERKGQLDYEFFLLLSASIEEVRQEGNGALAEQLAALRGKLLELTGAPEVAFPEDVEGEMTVEELIQEMLAHKDEEDFKALVALVRHLLDYQFFQRLTGQIEAAQGKGEEEQARELTELRSKILDLLDELNREAKEEIERANTLLRQILDSEDMLAEAEKNAEQMGGTVLAVLQANIIAAREAEQEEMVKKLEDLHEHILSMLEARMPPEVRMINGLLATEGSEERQQLLQDEAELVDERFLQLLKLVSEDLRRQGHKKASEHLEESVKQVEAMLQTEGGDEPEG